MGVVCFRLQGRRWRDQYCVGGKYREALLELSPEELPRRIDAAERAIHQRIEELGRTGDGSGEERQAMEDALRGLRVLARTEGQTQRAIESDLAGNEVASKSHA